MARYVFGIKWYTTGKQTDIPIGLYSGTIKWLENEVSGLTAPWKVGMLYEEGLGTAGEQSADFRKSGDVAQISGTIVRARNIVNLPNGKISLIQRLSDLGLNLNGMRCSIVRINVDTLEEELYYSGTGEEPKSSDAIVNIPVSESGLLRNANLTSEYSEDGSNKRVTRPVTIGLYDAQYAKLARVKATETTLDARGVLEAMGDTANVLVPNAKIFPVIDSITRFFDDYDYTDRYTIDLSNSNSGTGGNVTNPTNFYLKVAIDANGNSGRLRKIKKIIPEAVASKARITVLLESYFPTALDADSNGDGAYVTIVQIEREYELDDTKCGGFLDDEGNIIDPNTDEYPELYAYASDRKVTVSGSGSEETVPVVEQAQQFFRLPAHAYDIERNDNNNKIIIVPSLFEDNVDTFLSYIMYPVSGFGKIISQNLLDDWGEPGWEKVKEGLYRYPHNSGLGSSDAGKIGFVTDRLSDTSFQVNLTFNQPGNVSFYLATAYRFGLPPFPQNFTFDKAYIGIKFESQLAFTVNAVTHPFTTGFRLKYRRFKGSGVEIADTTTFNFGDIVQTYHVKNMPDFYYKVDPRKNNRYFYIERTSGVWRTGKDLLEIEDINNEDRYNSIYDCAIISARSITGGGADPIQGTGIDRIFEVCIIFEKKMSIQKEIFSFARGRLFNDDWDGRKNKDALIQNPIDIAEMILRMSNWGDVTRKEYQWGKEYCAEALINTGTEEGGFDSPRLDQLKDLVCARQLLQYNDGWTTTLLKSLCRSFLLCQYRLSNGQECISYIGEKSANLPADRIDENDIPIGMQPGELEEPRAEDIYCNELIIKYNINPATGEPESFIEIRNVSAASYDPSYVIGYDGGYKQAIWERAHALWVKYHRTERPPEDLVTFEWVCDTETAGWRVLKWLNFMDKKRVRVPICYEKGKDWHICKRVTWNHPHRTSGVDVECLIEQYIPDPYSNRIDLRLMLYDGFIDSSVSLSSASTSVSGSSSSDSSSSSYVSSSSNSLSSSSISTSSTSVSSSSTSGSVSSSSSASMSAALKHKHYRLWEEDLSDVVVQGNNNQELKVMTDFKGIVADTADGSDDRSLYVSGGGGYGTTRGATILFAGNENALTGKLILQAGNVAGGEIQFTTGGSTQGVIDENGNFIIGGTSTSYKMHVYGGSSGFTPEADADELVVESSAVTGISILTPIDVKGTISFKSDNGAGAGAETFHIESEYNSGAGYQVTTMEFANYGNIQSAASGGYINMRIDGVTLTAYQKTQVDFNSGQGNIPYTFLGATDANLLVVDTTNDKVGIGDSSPDAKLEVVNSAFPQLRLTRVATSNYTNLGIDGSDRFIIAKPNSASIAFMIESDADFMFNMGDTAGARKVYFRDSGGTSHASIDSDGNAQFDGQGAFGVAIDSSIQLYGLAPDAQSTIFHAVFGSTLSDATNNYGGAFYAQGGSATNNYGCFAKAANASGNNYHFYDDAGNYSTSAGGGSWVDASCTMDKKETSVELSDKDIDDLIAEVKALKPRKMTAKNDPGKKEFIACALDEGMPDSVVDRDIDGNITGYMVGKLGMYNLTVMKALIKRIEALEAA